MRHLTLAVALALPSAGCSSEEPVAAPAECTVNTFRACETDACRGVEQCLEAGEWSACECVVTDASYADAAGDASADASTDASTDASPDATDGS